MTQISTDSAQTRRNVLGFACAGGLAAISGAAGAAPAPWLDLSEAAPPPGPLADAGFEAWRGIVGRGFVVAETGTRLDLVAVERFGPGSRRGAKGRRQAFGALFEARGGGAPAGDAIYRLASPRLPALHLHLGARADGSGRARYLAVFN